MLQKTEKKLQLRRTVAFGERDKVLKKELPVKYSVDAAMRHQRKFMFI